RLIPAVVKRGQDLERALVSGAEELAEIAKEVLVDFPRHQHVPQLACERVPLSRDSVRTSCHDGPSVRGKREAGDPLPVRQGWTERPTRGRLPQLSAAVFAACQDALAIGAHGQAPERLGKLPRAAERPARGRFPQLNLQPPGTLPCSRDRGAAIRT